MLPVSRHSPPLGCSDLISHTPKPSTVPNMLLHLPAGHQVRGTCSCRPACCHWVSLSVLYPQQHLLQAQLSLCFVNWDPNQDKIPFENLETNNLVSLPCALSSFYLQKWVFTVSSMYLGHVVPPFLSLIFFFTFFSYLFVSIALVIFIEMSALHFLPWGAGSQGRKIYLSRSLRARTKTGFPSIIWTFTLRMYVLPWWMT